MWVDVAILKVVGFGSLGLLILGWLTVSFQKPGPGRARTSRLSSAFLYLALASLFTDLSQNAWGSGRWALLVPFGFLLAVFVVGFFVTLVKWLGQLSGGASAADHATH